MLLDYVKSFMSDSTEVSSVQQMMNSIYIFYTNSRGMYVLIS